MAKATGAVKLFGPRLRCRKAAQVSNLAGSNDVIICDCVNWRFRASFVSYLYVYIALKWSFFANSVTIMKEDHTIKWEDAEVMNHS